MSATVPPMSAGAAMRVMPLEYATIAERSATIGDYAAIVASRFSWDGYAVGRDSGYFLTRAVQPHATPNVSNREQFRLLAMLPTNIDRIHPTRRPDQPVCGWQSWRQLLFLHWEMSPELLRPLAPKELEIDVHNGSTYVGLVPFQMLNVRPWTWWPQSAGFRFLETNVRIYVHYQGRPGVYFLSLEAASWLAVRAARFMWGLPYYYARMRHTKSAEGHRYQSTRRGKQHAASDVRFQVGAALPPASQNSLEFFLLERYLLFVERDGAIWEGQVHHTPYPAHLVNSIEVEDSLMRAAGVEVPSRLPEHAHYSPGVDVEIFPLRRMPA